MNNKMSKVFQNRINKNINNNDNFYYSHSNNNMEIKNIKEKIMDKTKLNRKINEIFTSPNYIYKANVEIKTKEKTYITKIIGRNKTHLITLDNKIIPINSILDINKK